MKPVACACGTCLHVERDRNENSTIIVAKKAELNRQIHLS